MSERRRRIGAWFFAGAFAVTLALAGVLSSVAASTPDGLEAVVRQGCIVVDTPRGEQLRGSCIAQDADDHALSASPLGDYTVAGDARLTGVAGVIGVLVAFGLMWLLLRLPRHPGSSRPTED